MLVILIHKPFVTKGHLLLLGHSTNLLRKRLVTSDVDIECKGQTLVKLKPRKTGTFSRRSARPGVLGTCKSKRNVAASYILDNAYFNLSLLPRVTRIFQLTRGFFFGCIFLAHLEEKTGSSPAGLEVSGLPYEPDMEATFDVYKTFEIEFETEPSKSANFYLFIIIIFFFSALLAHAAAATPPPPQI
jgi:hypothetical protein